MKESIEQNRRARVFISCGQTKDSDELDTATPASRTASAPALRPQILMTTPSISRIEKDPNMAGAAPFRRRPLSNRLLQWYSVGQFSGTL